MSDDDITTVQVTKGTRDRMKGALITKRESYDELINRLLDGAGK